jgi:hypothetical protein
MVGGRRSTLLYGNSDENEMIEGRPVYERTKVSEALADASGGSGTEGGMVLTLRDAAGAVQDVLVRVDARTSVSQVQAVALRELMRRGVHSKLVSKLLFSGKFLKDNDIVSTTLLAATSQVGSKGLDARPVVHMLLAKFEKKVSTREMSGVAQDEAAAAKDEAIVARVIAAALAALRAGREEQRSASRALAALRAGREEQRSASREVPAPEFTSLSVN